MKTAINIFRTPEINQKLLTTQGVFIQEKWQNLKKIARHVTCPNLSLLSKVCCLESQQLHLTSMAAVKTSNPATLEWAEQFWSSPKAESPENCHSLACLAAHRRAPFSGLVFIWSDSELSECDKSYPRGNFSSQNKKQSTGTVPEEVQMWSYSTNTLNHSL